MMDNRTLILLIAAIVLVLAGCIVICVAMTVNNWDFTRISTNTLVNNRYEITEPYQNISIVTNTADVEVLYSGEPEGYGTVVCDEYQNESHSVRVEDGTLKIEVLNEKKWYEYIGIGGKTPRITVYLSKTEFETVSIEATTADVELDQSVSFENISISVTTGDVMCRSSAKESLSVKTTTGDIKVEKVSAKNMTLAVTTGDIVVEQAKCEGEVNVKVSTGKTRLSEVSCQNLVSKGTTGKITLEQTVAGSRLDIQRGTGDVKLEKCDADEISIRTNTGDVTGSLLSEKVFIASSDTGSVQVPKTANGGRCEITTDTGDIKITVCQG